MTPLAFKWGYSSTLQQTWQPDPFQKFRPKNHTFPKNDRHRGHLVVPISCWLRGLSCPALRGLRRSLFSDHGGKVTKRWRSTRQATSRLVAPVRRRCEPGFERRWCSVERPPEAPISCLRTQARSHQLRAPAPHRPARVVVRGCVIFKLGLIPPPAQLSTCFSPVWICHFFQYFSYITLILQVFVSNFPPCTIYEDAVSTILLFCSNFPTDFDEIKCFKLETNQQIIALKYQIPSGRSPSL